MTPEVSNNLDDDKGEVFQSALDHVVLNKDESEVLIKTKDHSSHTEDPINNEESGVVSTGADRFSSILIQTDQVIWSQQ